MTLVNIKELEKTEVYPGFQARFVHSDNMTLAYWNIEAGAPLPEHSHPHEQITCVLEGELEFTVGEETVILVPGLVKIVSGNTPHSGKALTDCILVGIFHPAREEFK